MVYANGPKDNRFHAPDSENGPFDTLANIPEIRRQHRRMLQASLDHMALRINA